MVLRIFCINKTDRLSPHERINAIGGFNSDNTRWHLTLSTAINGIREGKWTFYVENPPGHKVEIVIARTASGQEYLKTAADGDQPSTLVNLPECSSR
jgi:Protein of unknown function (DUF3892)